MQKITQGRQIRFSKGGKTNINFHNEQKFWKSSYAIISENLLDNSAIADFTTKPEFD